MLGLGTACGPCGLSEAVHREELRDTRLCRTGLNWEKVLDGRGMRACAYSASNTSCIREGAPTQETWKAGHVKDALSTPIDRRDSIYRLEVQFLSLSRPCGGQEELKDLKKSKGGESTGCDSRSYSNAERPPTLHWVQSIRAPTLR